MRRLRTNKIPYNKSIDKRLPKQFRMLAAKLIRRQNDMAEKVVANILYEYSKLAEEMGYKKKRLVVRIAETLITGIIVGIVGGLIVIFCEAPIKRLITKIQIRVYPTNIEIFENGGQGSFQLSLLSKPTDNIVVDVKTADPSEVMIQKNGSEELSETISLIFNVSDWNIPQKINLIGVDDPISDGDKVVPIRIVVSSATDRMGKPPIITATLKDDELSFSESKHFSESPYGTVLFGDIDNDGDCDALFIKAYKSSTKISRYQNNEIWINNGKGEFEKSKYSLGNRISRAVELDDVDRDGDIDVFIGNKIFENRGLGQFIEREQTIGGEDNYRVRFGDLDKDGDLDAVVIIKLGRNQIWLNDGYGNYQNSLIPLENSKGWDLELGDVDNDGDLDIFHINTSGDIEISLNNGGKSFSVGKQRISAKKCFAMALGDLDNDGDLDIFQANFYAQPNRVWLNDGKGNFTDSGQAIGNSSSNDVVLGDIDCDGDLDAFIANRDPDDINGQPNKLWLNNGEGRFTDSGISLGNQSSQALAISDVDKDGDLDVIFANYRQGTSGQNQLYLNNLIKTPKRFVPTGQNFGGIRSDLIFGDVDKDGDLDVFVMGGEGSQLWLNDRFGHFAQSHQPLWNSGGSKAVFGDLDRDGDLDLLLTGGKSKLFLNDGTGKFSENNNQNYNEIKASAVALGDIDKDGDLDAVFAGNEQPNSLWLNDGNRGFKKTTEFSMIITKSRSVKLGDFDKDGDLDVFFQNYSNRNTIWFNNGKGQFRDSYRLNNAFSITECAFGDLDRDGDLDIFLTSFRTPSTIWFNNGKGQFTDSGQLIGKSHSNDVALGDADGDGDLDAFVANSVGQPDKLWLNDGNGIFKEGIQTFDSSSTNVVLGDIDLDGDLDVSFLYYGNINVVWINE